MSDRLPAFLALSCVGAFAAFPAHAEADEADQPDRNIVVTGTREAPVELESPKSVTSLADTPQTVTVISDQTLRKQNLLTLRDALQTIPGITFAAAEGGAGYGDAINLRGYSASNDITVDGVRDSAQYSRTDPFNLQQIEIFNGANSVFNGSGSVGGTINLASKEPRPADLTILQGAIGTDAYYRGAVDSNLRVSPKVAVRLNAMIHRNDVAGRDVENYRRWGVAPAITFGIDGPTSMTLAYVHQQDDNIPLFGVPYVQNQINAGPLPEVDRSDYFGMANLDKQKTRLDRVTATFRHAFSDDVSIRNLTRWQRVGQYSVTSAPQGTYCLTGTGRQPIAASATATQGLACTATIANVATGAGPALGSVTVTVPPGFYQPSGPRGLVRDTVNDLFYNQTDLRWVAGEEGGLRNTLVIGGVLSWEDYEIINASLPRNAAGAPVLLPQIDLSNPDTIYTGPVNYTVTARSKSSTRNTAIYAFDNLELTPWLELNAGVRYETNTANFRAVPLASYPPGTSPLSPAAAVPQVSDEHLFSYRGGVVVKPLPNVSLYAAYGNSRTPSSATVRLGCGTVTVSPAGTADPCAVAPEKARNYEIGVKANLFGDSLLVSAAAFRNERTNFRTPSNDPSLPTALQVLDGRSRVDGIVVGASGTILPGWSVFANYTYLDGQVRQSVSDFCLANAGATGCGNSATILDPQAGDRLIQTPKHSGSLFTTYTLPFGLQIGYGLTYQGSFAFNQRNLAGRTQYFSEDYLIHRAFLAYEIGNGLTAQLNVSNFTDERYLTNIRNNIGANGAISGGWAMPGDRRQATFSLFYSF